MECWLEACHSSVWNRCDLPTVWAGYAKTPLPVSNYQSHQTVLAVDMKALEQFGVRVSVKTHRTVQLLF